MEKRISPYWLGGFFEAGCLMGYKVYGPDKRHPLRQAIYPVISYQDNSRLRIEALQNMAGGSMIRVYDRYWRWTVSGQEACDLTANVAALAPSRSLIINSFNDWMMASTKERIEIAKTVMSNKHNYDDVDPDGYRPVAENLEYLAGAIDSRGLFDWINIPYNGRDYHIPRLHINSTNELLLKALQEAHGGSLIVAVTEGKVVKVTGKVYKTQKNYLRLSWSRDEALELARQLEPHLVMRAAQFREVLSLSA